MSRKGSVSNTAFVTVGFFALISTLTSSTNPAYDKAESELTITVKPSTIECFYQRAHRNEILEIEYQVVDASFGEVEINQELEIIFYMHSPEGLEVIRDFKQSDAIHRYEVKEDGDYKLCFDNTFSHFSKKTVYFEIYVDSDGEDDDQWDNIDMFPPELIYNDTMDQIKNSIIKVKDNLNRVKHFQDQMRAIESRDRNIQEHNFTRVNHFSILIIIVMMVVGGVQVLMVRSLFEEKSKLHKIFRLVS